MSNDSRLTTPRIPPEASPGDAGFVEEKTEPDNALGHITRRLDELAHKLRRMTAENLALREQVGRDSLTGLINQGESQKALEQAFAVTREKGAPLSLIFIDFDNFKSVNTKHGQIGGNKVLTTVVDAIAAETRPTDLFGRFGGEEFIMIMPGADALQAQRALERIRAKIASKLEFDIDGDRFTQTFSAGIASNEDAQDVEELVTHANAAEQSAKDEGKKRTHVYAFGGILNAEEITRINATPDLLAIIRKYQAGQLKIMRGGKPVPLFEFLQFAKHIKPGDAQEGDYSVVGAGDGTCSYAAWMRGPQDGAMSSVLDTAHQLTILAKSASPGVSLPIDSAWQYVGQLNALNLLLTHRCCMDCVYCKQNHKDQTGLPLEIWQRAINEASDNGKRRGVVLWLTGGEPLMDDITPKLIAHGHAQGMYVAMNTNAMLIRERMACKIIDAGISSLNVSLDSIIALEEDRITRTRQALPKIFGGLEAIARIRKELNGKCQLRRVTINIVLTSENYRDFPRTVEDLCEKRRRTMIENGGLILFDDINPLPVKDARELYLGQN
ncbi:MAG: diguanylate cyclase, partial [Candidatus Micrarchaeia archaeon]